MEKHGGEVDRVELKYDRLTQRMRQVDLAVVLSGQFIPIFNGKIKLLITFLYLYWNGCSLESTRISVLVIGHFLQRLNRWPPWNYLIYMTLLDKPIVNFITNISYFALALVNHIVMNIPISIVFIIYCMFHYFDRGFGFVKFKEESSADKVTFCVFLSSA